jgi:AcrR family transcriptional regulator
MPRTLTQAAVENFRDRLRKIATELFIEAGYDGFNMRELAKRVGVSAMTPYRYFSDKEEILASVRAQAFAGLADRLDSARGLRGSPAEKITAVACAYIEFAQQEQPYYRLMFDFSRPKSASFPDLDLHENRVRSGLTMLMRDLVDRGALDGDPELMAQFLWSAMHGAVALTLADERRSIALFEVVREVRRLVLIGYGPDSASVSTQVMATDDDPTFSALQSRTPRREKSNFAVLTAAE